MERHRLPAATPDPAEAPSGGEIRFPTAAGSHNTRAQREEDE